VIPSIIFNLNFQFNQKNLKINKYHLWLFNPLVIFSVIFNLNLQFNQKFVETHQITSMNFQFIGDFVCKEQ